MKYIYSRIEQLCKSSCVSMCLCALHFLSTKTVHPEIILNANFRVFSMSRWVDPSFGSFYPQTSGWWRHSWKSNLENIQKLISYSDSPPWNKLVWMQIFRWYELGPFFPKINTIKVVFLPPDLVPKWDFLTGNWANISVFHFCTLETSDH